MGDASPEALKRETPNRFTGKRLGVLHAMNAAKPPQSERAAALSASRAPMRRAMIPQSGGFSPSVAVQLQLRGGGAALAPGARNQRSTLGSLSSVA